MGSVNPPSEPSLYEALGGHEAIFACVGSFYEKVMGDPTLAPFFAHLDMRAQSDKQVAYLTMALGGPSRYSGRDLRTAHAKLVRSGLSDAHFDRVAEHLRTTLEELAVRADLVSKVMAAVDGLRADVLDR